MGQTNVYFILHGNPLWIPQGLEQRPWSPLGLHRWGKLQPLQGSFEPPYKSNLTNLTSLTPPWKSLRDAWNSFKGSWSVLKDNWKVTRAPPGPQRSSSMRQRTRTAFDSEGPDPVRPLSIKAFLPWKRRPGVIGRNLPNKLRWSGN